MRPIRTALAVAAMVITAISMSGATALANNSDQPLPAEWHVHDGGSPAPLHRPVGFFPTILGEDLSTYLEDPVRCPDATDKAFLPSGATPAYTEGGAQGQNNSDVLRAGICETSTLVIRLRTVTAGIAGPAGWSGPVTTFELGAYRWTWYVITPR